MALFINAVPTFKATGVAVATHGVLVLVRTPLMPCRPTACRHSEKRTLI